MKDLSSFEAVKQAMAQVMAANTVDNGTMGMKFLAYYWAWDYAYDVKREELNKDRVRAMFANKDKDILAIDEEMAKLGAPPVIMEFRLVKPIPLIRGTKIVFGEDKKSYSPKMENVEAIYIPELSVKLGLVEYEETEEKAVNQVGVEIPVILIHLKKGIIDVKEAIKDRRGNLIRAARASLTPISYRAMQIAGKVISAEDYKREQMYGFEQNL